MLRKGLFVVGLATILLGSGVNLLMSTATAQSTERPRWIDAAQIEYEGRIYFDANPYDADGRAGVADGDCYDDLEYNGDRTQITNRWDESGDFCDEESNGDDIDISNPNFGFIAGYRIAEDTVILYSTKGEPGNLPDLLTFRLAEGRDADTYYLETDDGFVESIHLTFDSNGTIDLTSAGRAGAGLYDVPISIFFGDSFRLANNGDVIEPPIEGFNPETGEVGDGDGGADDNSCEANAGVTGWIICAVLGWMDSVLSAIDNQIQELLNVDNNYFDGMEEAASSLRTIAFSILVPIMLIMVIATALGFDFISAYTVKKALPRLVVAVIFIAVSFPLMVFLVNVTNTVGNGISGLILGAVGAGGDITLQSVFSPSGGGQAAGTIGATALVASGVFGALAVGSIGIIFSYLLVALVALVIGFFLLSLRQFMIIILALLAPLAILSWIFPGNDKLWKVWWGTFSKLLMMFPLIMLMLASGKAFVYLINQSGKEGDLITPLIKLVAYIGPYFLIPATFKLAGGAFAAISGMAENRGRGLLDRNKKYRSEKMSQNWGKTKNYSRFSDRNKLTRGLNTVLGAGASPRDLARGRKGITAGRYTGIANQGAAALESDQTWAKHQNDDNFLLAVANRNLAQQRIKDARSRMNDSSLTDDERNAAKADYAARQGAMDQANRVISRNSAGTRLAALNQLAKTGYQLSPGDVGYGELSSTVADIAGPKGSGAYASAMNEAQYYLKGAGRADLGGINHGDKNSIKSGVRKLSNYQRGQGKTDQYHGAASAWLGSDTVGEDGKTLGAQEMANSIGANLGSGEVSVDDVGEYHEMLLRDLGSATDANKIEIQKQIDAIELESTRGVGDPASIARGENHPLAQRLANNRASLRRDSGVPEAELQENQ